MFKTKTFVLPALKTRTRIITFTSLLAIATVVPFFIHSQYITGPLVNFILFTAVILLGPFEAVLLGIIPSTVALASGLLPLPLAPMIPFIMVGNALLVAVFYYTRKIGFIKSVILASLLKFLFLHSIVTLLMSTLLAEKLVANLAIMMSWPQFVTAVAGGVVAYMFLKKIRRI